MAYLGAARETENELPYGNIVCLNEHGAVLHYTNLERNPPLVSNSLLIDAARVSTATPATSRARMRALRRKNSSSSSTRSIARSAISAIAYAMARAIPHCTCMRITCWPASSVEHGFVRMSAESVVESGVSSTFFPHGLGHYIGLQVHDVGGFQASETGGTPPKPDGHPYLRSRATSPRVRS